MTSYICVTCGVQFTNAEAWPEACPICMDERQYVNWAGQSWVTYLELCESHNNIMRPETTGLSGIGTEPGFAIGQRALLVQSEQGNVLWDCTPLVDTDIVDKIKALGGLC